MSSFLTSVLVFTGAVTWVVILLIAALWALGRVEFHSVDPRNPNRPDA